MWATVRNSVILGFAAGFIAPWFPRLGFTLLTTVILAVLFKICWRLNRLDRALQTDRVALHTGIAPRAMVAWKNDPSIDQKYRIGWVASIGVVSAALSTLPIHIAAGFTVYSFFAGLLVFVFYAFRIPYSRRQFFVALGEWNSRMRIRLEHMNTCR